MTEWEREGAKSCHCVKEKWLTLLCLHWMCLDVRLRRVPENEITYNNVIFPLSSDLDEKYMNTVSARMSHFSHQPFSPRASDIASQPSLLCLRVLSFSHGCDPSSIMVWLRASMMSLSLPLSKMIATCWKPLLIRDFFSLTVSRMFYFFAMFVPPEGWLELDVNRGCTSWSEGPDQRLLITACIH